ncbi:MAG: Adenylyl cyclase, partial [Acidobacteriaceae bacterium]|nr:Adenylyl cyclase [Acidobacteriaceae bacterium]
MRLCGTLLLAMGAMSTAAIAQATPNFGPNVLVFDPSMSTAQIQSQVNAIATQQVSNQFG